MDVACAYEDTAVTHELVQGIQSAYQLMHNLHSPEEREFWIRKLVSSYDNTLSALKHRDNFVWKPLASALPVPGSANPVQSPRYKEFVFDKPFVVQEGQNVTSSKRKLGFIISEDEVRICGDKGLEYCNTNDRSSRRNRKFGGKDILGDKLSINKVQKGLTTKQVKRTEKDHTYKLEKHNNNNVLNSMTTQPLPPQPLPEIHAIDATYPFHQLSPPNVGEILSNLNANPGVNEVDFAYDNIASSFGGSVSSPSSGLSEDYNHLKIQDYYGDDLMQVYLSFISPSTTKSKVFADRESLQSLDFFVHPTDVFFDLEHENFELENSFF